MSKTIIIYKSKYGAAKEYAHLLAGKLHETVTDLEQLEKEVLISYDTIILCGGIYVSGISGLSFFKKNPALLKDKKVIIFAVGVSPYDENAINQLKKHNLKDSLQGVPLFYGRGAWNEEAMTFRDRTLCRLLKASVSRKNPAEYEPWEAALVDGFGKTSSWVDEKYLTPLIDSVTF